MDNDVMLTSLEHPAYSFGQSGIYFEMVDGLVWFSADRFANESEHISLDAAADGSEIGYVNHTECFGGRFTGI